MSETLDPGAAAGAPAIDLDPTATAAPPAHDPAAPPGSAALPDADDAGADDQQQGPARPARGVQKRIDELTARWHSAERRNEELIRLLQSVAGQQHQPAAPQGAAPQGAQPAAEPPLPPDLAQMVGPAPNPADFAAGEYDPAYIRAAARHDMKLDQARMVAQQRQAMQRQAEQQIVQRAAQIVEKAMAADPAIAEAVQDPSFPCPPHVVRVLTEMEAPEGVLAHLAKNRAEAARIAKLPPLAVATELGKIAGRLALAPAAPQPSAAPPPPRPVRSGAGTAPPSVADMSVDQIAKHLGLR